MDLAYLWIWIVGFLFVSLCRRFFKCLTHFRSASGRRFCRSPKPRFERPDAR